MCGVVGHRAGSTSIIWTLQRCVRTCGLAPASSLPLGRRFLRNIGQVDELVAMLFRQDL